MDTRGQKKAGTTERDLEENIRERKGRDGMAELEGSGGGCHGQATVERPVPRLMLHEELRG